MKTDLNKVIKRTAIGLLSTSALTVAAVGGAYAGATIEEVKAYFNKGIKVTIDGKETSFQDGDGNTVYPLIQNGSSYFPARALTGALGGEIDWNEKTNTIAIATAVYGKTPQEANPYKDAKQYEGTPVDTNNRIDEGFKLPDIVVALPMGKIQDNVDTIIVDAYNQKISDKRLYSFEYLKEYEQISRDPFRHKHTLNRAKINAMEYYYADQLLRLEVVSDVNLWGPEDDPYTKPQRRSHEFVLFLERAFDGSFVLTSLS